jgi:DNA-binding winged helix-turn-helix (wHTH) protein
MFRPLEAIFVKYLQQHKKVLIAIDNSAQISLDNVPEFRDLIVFLDQMRFTHNGNINFLISTSIPIFTEQNPSPCPIITQYFNYYNPGWLYRSINEEILANTFKRHGQNDVLKLIEITGGLVSLAKNLMRDFIMQDKKLDDLESLIVDDSFFDKYINCKMRLDRYKVQMGAIYRQGLLSIVEKGNIEGISPEVLNYLSQTGILDEEFKLRGTIFPAYVKKYFGIPISQKVSEVIEAERELGQSVEASREQISDSADSISINNILKVNIKSGEILKNNLPQDEYLAENELKVFILLNSNLNAPVTREAIAKILWTDHGVNDYSDWAIDKMISRIREKLHDEKPYRLIKTIRGIGFELIR